jgi:Sulfotransferase domain
MKWYLASRSPVSFRVGFLIAGVQKAGTFSLFQLLRQHPKIGVSTTKEVHFFDDDTTVDWSKPAYDRYHGYFANKPGKTIFGEATPIYIYWPNALERIKAYNPDIKLILLFRDPIDRAYSAWCHQKRKGREALTFADAIRSGRERVTNACDFANRHFSYVERGFYARQLSRVFEEFPKANVLALESRQLAVAPSRLVQMISTFLGLEPTTQTFTPPHANKRSRDANALPPSPDDIRLLTHLFAPELAKFAKLINFSIDHWLTSRLLSGSASAEEAAAELAEPGFGKMVTEAPRQGRV